MVFLNKQDTSNSSILFISLHNRTYCIHTALLTLVSKTNHLKNTTQLVMQSCIEVDQTSE